MVAQLEQRLTAQGTWPLTVPGSAWTRVFVFPPCLVVGFTWLCLNHFFNLAVVCTARFGDPYLVGDSGFQILPATNLLVAVYVLIHLLAFLRGRERRLWIPRLGCLAVLFYLAGLHLLQVLLGNLFFKVNVPEECNFYVVIGEQGFSLHMPKDEFERSRNRIEAGVSKGSGRVMRERFYSVLEVSGDRFVYWHKGSKLLFGKQTLRSGDRDYGPIPDNAHVRIRTSAVIVNGEIRGILPSR